MTARRSGLLIVNADDFGITTAVTNAVLSCFEGGAISSATAMVWMADSDRAASVARQRRLPIGLHLNLIEPFSAPDVPGAVAQRQVRIVDRLSSGRASAHVYHPGWSRDFERCIGDQLARFERTYGRPPTHVDGHQHMHLALNALLARALTPVARGRRPLNRLASESRPHKRAARALLQGLVRRRLVTTDWCFSIRALVPALGGAGIEQKLALAANGSVEVMVHPGWPDELAILHTPEWLAQLHRYRLGSYADLPTRARPGARTG
jgi:hypothetical protein